MKKPATYIREEGRQILDYANNNILFNRRFQMKKEGGEL